MSFTNPYLVKNIPTESIRPTKTINNGSYLFCQNIDRVSRFQNYFGNQSNQVTQVAAGSISQIDMNSGTFVSKIDTLATLTSNEFHQTMYDFCCDSSYLYSVYQVNGINDWLFIYNITPTGLVVDASFNLFTYIGKKLTSLNVLIAIDNVYIWINTYQFKYDPFLKTLTIYNTYLPNLGSITSFNGSTTTFNSIISTGEYLYASFRGSSDSGTYRFIISNTISTVTIQIYEKLTTIPLLIAYKGNEYGVLGFTPIIDRNNILWTIALDNKFIYSMDLNKTTPDVNIYCLTTTPYSLVSDGTYIWTAALIRQGGPSKTQVDVYKISNMIKTTYIYGGETTISNPLSIFNPTPGYPVYLNMYKNVSSNTLWVTDFNNNMISKYSLPINCFKSGSQILTEYGYKAIEDLKKGDLIQTRLNGFVAIHSIGKKNINHPAEPTRIKDQLYRCSNEFFPEVFEDLIITGCHSILVDEYKTPEEREKTIEINGNTYVTEQKYRLPACADERTVVYEVPGNYTIYHLALEHEDYYMNYGIYANGLLVESCSQRFLTEISGMELL